TSIEPRTLNASAALAWPSPLTESLLRRVAPDRADDAAAFLERWGISIEADLAAAVESSPAGATIGDVRVAPRSLAIERDGAVTFLAVDSGTVALDGGRIEIEGLTLRNEALRATIEGDAVTGAAPSINLFIT